MRYIPFMKSVLLCFFVNDTATTEIYTLSLHDALPIWSGCRAWVINWGSARHCNSRHRLGHVRGLGVALLEHALAHSRGEARPARLGARGDPRAARSTRLAYLSRHLRGTGAALRLRAGALRHDVPRGDPLLDREPVLQPGRHAAARARRRGALRAAALLVPRPQHAGPGLQRLQDPPRTGPRGVQRLHHRALEVAGDR